MGTNKLRNPVGIDTNDDSGMLFNCVGYSPYLTLDQLEFIKHKLDRTIEFAKTNDVDKLNQDCLNKALNRTAKKTCGNSRINYRKTNIYLMIDHNMGYHKIGRSKDPLKRERTLQSEKPTIELVHTWKGFYNDETSLHERFEEKRIRGEWFNLSPSDISELTKL